MSSILFACFIELYILVNIISYIFLRLNLNFAPSPLR